MILDEILCQSAALHSHLCPRQVLGVRIGLLAGKLLDLEVPRRDKRLLAIVETDGCAADGVSVATGCWVGKRTLRIEDFGKVAATFVDTHTGHTIRVAPRSQARDLALDYVPEAHGNWEAQLLGYQLIPDDELLTWQEVTLTASVEKIVSRPGLRVVCDRCGEEVMNEREVIREGVIFCRSCAGGAYYQALDGASPSTTANRCAKVLTPANGLPQPEE